MKGLFMKGLFMKGLFMKGWAKDPTSPINSALMQKNM